MFTLQRVAAALAVALGLAACTSKAPPSIGDGMDRIYARASAVVVAEVPEAVRRERALQLVQQLRSQDLVLLSELETLTRQRKQMNLDYDTTRAEFETWAASFHAVRRRYRRDLARSLDELKQVLTTREWSELWDVYDSEISKVGGVL